MDILLPPLERQAAPAPSRLLRERLDLQSLVATQARRLPSASAGEIVARLADSGISASGVWLARWLMQRPDHAQRNRVRPGAMAASSSSAAAAATVVPRRQTRPTLASGDGALRVLNRLFVEMYYSLARYVQGAAPWLRRRDAALWNLVRRIAGEHEQLATGAARLVIDRRQRLEHGQYPAEFTANNDLALEHLAGKLLDDQRRLIDQLEHARIEASHDDAAASLLDDAIASQRQTLLDLQHVLEVDAQAMSASLDISGEPAAARPHDAPTRSKLPHSVDMRQASGEPHTAA